MQATKIQTMKIKFKKLTRFILKCLPIHSPYGEAKGIVEGETHKQYKIIQLKTKS